MITPELHDWCEAQAQDRLVWDEQWRKLDDYLSDVHLVHLKSRASKQYPKRAQQWAQQDAWETFPFVQMICQRTATKFYLTPQFYLYRRDALGNEVELDPSKSADQIQLRQWSDDVEAAALEDVLRSADLRVAALNNVVISPTWIAPNVKWQVFAPHQMKISPAASDPSDLSRARGIAYCMHAIVKGEAVKVWSVWRIDDNGRFTHSVVGEDYRAIETPTRLFESEQNDYGLQPFVLWQSRDPGSLDVWVPPSESLLRTQESIDIGLTDLHYGLTYGAHPIWQEFGKALNRDEDVLDPGARRKYDRKQDHGLVPVKVDLNIDEVRDTIEWRMQMAAVGRRLPPDTFAVNSSTRNLGAKQHESHELSLERRSGYSRVRRVLGRAFEIHKRIGNHHALGNARARYDDDVRLGVRLAEIPTVEEPLTGAQASLMRRQAGLDSVIEEEQRQSGVGRELARKRVMQRVADEAAVEVHRQLKQLEALDQAIAAGAPNS